MTTGWRLRRLAAAAVVAGANILPVVPAAAVGAAAPRSTSGRLLCRLQDGRITEASGIARGIRSPGVLYVQNDSGDTNRFFALDARTCATAATITVPGARNVDWEDIAVAPDPQGRASVWLADIGNNDASRTQVQVYRVPEPRVDPAGRMRAVTSAAAQVWRLRYPSGPVDAESLAVDPRGVAYVVTKSYVGRSAVYRLPALPDPHRVRTLVRIGSISFAPVTTGGRLGVFGDLAATGAAISRDGALLAVRTYGDAYVWRVDRDDAAGALKRRPVHVTIPAQPQGEGIAVDSNRLLLDSEHADTAVYSIPLPPALLPRRAQSPAVSSTSNAAAAASAAVTTRSRTTTRTTSSTCTGASGAQSGSAAGTESISAAGAESGGCASGSTGSWLTGAVLLILVVAGSIAWWVLQLRGRRGMH